MPELKSSEEGVDYCSAALNNDRLRSARSETVAPCDRDIDDGRPRDFPTNIDRSTLTACSPCVQAGAMEHRLTH